MQVKITLGCAFLLLFSISGLGQSAAVLVQKPLTIDKPGNYVLFRNLTVNDTDKIIIQTGGVTLDLNGYAISNTGTQSPTIHVELLPDSVVLDVRIVDGRLSGGSSGIHAAGSANGPGISLKLEGLEIHGTSGDGVHVVAPSNLEILRSSFRNIGDDGVHVAQGVSPMPWNARIAENSFSETSGCAIHVESPPPWGAITNNVFTRYALNGIDESAVMVVTKSSNTNQAAFVIANNTMSQGGAKAAGILLDLSGSATPIELKENVISNCPRYGIEIRSGGARITGNSIANNGLGGVRIAGSFSLIENNRISGNAGPGLQFANGNGHAYRDNYLRGNVNAVDDPFQNTNAGGNII